LDPVRLSIYPDGVFGGLGLLLNYAVDDLHALAEFQPRIGVLVKVADFAIVHFYSDIVAFGAFDAFLDLVAGIGATRDTGHGGHGFPGAVTDHAAQQAPRDTAGDCADAGAFAFMLDQVDRFTTPQLAQVAAILVLACFASFASPFAVLSLAPSAWVALMVLSSPWLVGNQPSTAALPTKAKIVTEVAAMTIIGWARRVWVFMASSPEFKLGCYKLFATFNVLSPYALTLYLCVNQL
jgi:hypothetical protein